MLEAALDASGRGLGLWGLVDENGPAIGFCGLGAVSPMIAAAAPDCAADIETLVALDPQAWGRGYATEALAEVTRYGLADLGRPRITDFVDEPNARSPAMMIRAGYRAFGRCPGPKHTLVCYQCVAKNETAGWEVFL
jgi:RimJ/RimL family protein N-acetyltransferase